MGLFKDHSEKTWEKALKALEKEKWAKALPLVKKVADEGLSSAQYQYALLLEQGLGTAPDAAEAALWYEKAAQQKHLKAMLTMARLLLQSPETYGNTAKAYTWYQTVYEIMENRFFADTERDDLQSKMEAIQEKALDERQTATDRAHEAYEAENYETALTLFSEAAQMGSENAMLSYGIMLAKGQGTARDYDRAFRYIKKAAQKGSAYAQFLCGDMCLYGMGMEESADHAFKFYLQAAYWGNADAQDQCGRMYRERQGLPLDLVSIDYEAAARKWLEMAAAQGHQEAAQLLADEFANAPSIEEQYQKAMAACQAGKHDEALPLLQPLVNAVYFPATLSYIQLLLEKDDWQKIDDAIYARQQAYMDSQYIKGSPYEETWNQIETLMKPYAGRFLDDLVLG